MQDGAEAVVRDAQQPTRERKKTRSCPTRQSALSNEAEDKHDDLRTYFTKSYPDVQQTRGDA